MRQIARTGRAAHVLVLECAAGEFEEYVEFGFAEGGSEIADLLQGGADQCFR